MDGTMQCPKCDYQMSNRDLNCPRCQGTGQLQNSAVASDVLNRLLRVGLIFAAFMAIVFVTITVLTLFGSRIQGWFA